MEFASSSLKSRKGADLLVLPFWKIKEKAVAAASFEGVGAAYQVPLNIKDFTGKEGEVTILYTNSKKEPRLALLGLGEKSKASVERLRRAYASLVKICRPKKIQTVNLLMPEIPALTESGVIRGVSEGLLLTNYSFDQLKHDSIKEQPTVLLTKATLIGIDQSGLALAKKWKHIAEGVYLTRDLVNGNSDDISPQYLVKFAQDLQKKLPHIKTTVFDKKRIEKEKMGLLLAVSRGASKDPAFIIMEYKGNPKSKDLTALVVKGVTFDTGGLNLKSANMETQKADMAAAAMAFGTVWAAAKIGLKVNVVVVAPIAENSIGPNSYKPGDVYKSYSGTTVEIGNTDAEGRLILADALAYTVKNLKPSRILDFATLTGAMDIALGSEAIGLLSNQDALADALIRAGYETYERVWRLPLFEEYREQIKSDVADIRNSGGRSASVITAGCFLYEFVGETPWAHCDIASTDFLLEAKRYTPKYATGIGVRLMIEFLENL